MLQNKTTKFNGASETVSNPPDCVCLFVASCVWCTQLSRRTVGADDEDLNVTQCQPDVSEVKEKHLQIDRNQ